MEKADSFPLSEMSPYRGISPTACSLRSPSLPPLLLERSIPLNRDGNKCDVILQNGCACAPGLTRPPSPTIRTAEPSLGTGGGPWVGIPFTQTLCQGSDPARTALPLRSSSLDSPRRGHQSPHIFNSRLCVRLLNCWRRVGQYLRRNRK